MERELRSVICPDHNLRYDPAQTDGCVRCMRLLGPGAGRMPAPVAAKQAASPSSATAKVVATIVVAVTLLLGWTVTRTTNVKAPEGAVVDDDNRFALIVPPRWKTVDPSTVTYLSDILSADDVAMTLISDKGRLAPTVLIEVLDGRAGTPSRRGFAEVEEAFRKEWGEDETLKLEVGLGMVDRLRAYRLTASTVVDRETFWIEEFLVPGRDHVYAISAVHLRDRREDNAAAARAVADGFRVLERPPLLRGAAQKLILGLLLAALIGGIRVLAKG